MPFDSITICVLEAWPLSRSVFPPSVRGASRETGGILRILHTPPFVRLAADWGVGTNSHDNSQLKGREEEARAPPRSPLRCLWVCVWPRGP